MATVEEKVLSLETILGEFIVHTESGFKRLENEMREFKDEMLAFKEEMLAFKEEMKEFKDEMLAFKDEMKIFKDKIEEENKRKNKEWSDLAKKMGTIVEDLIYPALKPVIEKYFKEEIKFLSRNILRRKDGESYELDAIALSEKKLFFVEVKSSSKVNYVDDILEKSKDFFKFFPEYKDKKLILIYGSITFDENVIKYATRKGIYVMGWREWEYMDILNFEDIKI